MKNGRYTQSGKSKNSPPKKSAVPVPHHAAPLNPYSRQQQNTPIHQIQIPPKKSTTSVVITTRLTSDCAMRSPCGRLAAAVTAAAGLTGHAGGGHAIHHRYSAARQHHVKTALSGPEVTTVKHWLRWSARDGAGVRPTDHRRDGRQKTGWTKPQRYPSMGIRSSEAGPWAGVVARRGTRGGWAEPTVGCGRAARAAPHQHYLADPRTRPTY